MGFRRPDDETPEGVRRDVRITVVLSVLLLALGAWGLWQGKTVTGLGSVWGGAVFLWLAFRNYRIAKGRGWFLPTRATRGDVNGPQE